MESAGLREQKPGHLDSSTGDSTGANLPLDLSLAGSGVEFAGTGAQAYEDLCLKTRRLID